MEVKAIKTKSIFIILSILIILTSITSVNASIDTNQIQNTSNNNITVLSDASSDLEDKINNANENDEIIIEKGTYKIHNIYINKSITLKGNGNARDIIIDGEEKSSIFLIRNPKVSVTFKNITFINGLTHDFGGAISIETGSAYVDNCIFANNTALSKTNAGAISNYGTKQNKAYLYVNNSLFINNHADHDGGAITTCYANSDIYNCVFINNSAVRDGGAIRVSVFGYGNVQDCIFMFNHADEWGGAYYSWSGESNIERCIFLNNTAGTNGGAVMVSGDINIEKSIIANNDGGETGGSFYIQQPMYDKKTNINVHDNLITNNTSPYGKEIFIKWNDSYNLYTNFNDNDWGSENPNDSSVIDPNNVTSRSKVSKTIKSNLFNLLSLDLLDKYVDLIAKYFSNDSLDDFKNYFKSNQNNETTSSEKPNYEKHTNHIENLNNDKVNPILTTNNTSNSDNMDLTTNNTFDNIINDVVNEITGNSTSHGNNKKAYELIEVEHSVAKQIASNAKYIILAFIIALILLCFGYFKNRKVDI